MPPVKSPMSSCVYSRSSGFCCLSSARIWSSSAGARRVRRQPEPECARGEAFAQVVEHRDVVVVGRIPESGPAGEIGGDLARVPRIAGGPPGIRDGVGVAGVVAGALPVGRQVLQVRDQRLVELADRAVGDELGDPRRRGVGDVVAAALAVALDLADLGRLVREVVVGDLDPVLVLELGDGVLGDVAVPVVDEQLLLGGGDRRRSGGWGRGRDRRRRGAGGRTGRRRRRARGALAARDEQLRQRGRGAERGDPAEELASAPAGLRELPGEGLVERQPGRLRGSGHDSSSSSADRSPITSASAGSQANRTDWPDSNRGPVLPARTDIARPPAVRI